MLRIVVKGFRGTEQRLLEGLVMVSRRRNPRLELLTVEQAAEADVFLIDGTDPAAMSWATQQSWLSTRVAIWVDARRSAPHHTEVQRPVNWPMLPMLIARALEQAGSVMSRAADAKQRPPSQANSGTATSRASEVADPRPIDTARGDILIVDDSLAVRNFLRSQLEGWGYRVTESDQAEAGVALATAKPFSAVLMDVLLPGIDGYEACRRIKSQASGTRTVPVVMLTSRSSPFDRIRGKMAGCDAYLTKPVDAADLATTLSRLAKPRMASPPGASADVRSTFLTRRAATIDPQP